LDKQTSYSSQQLILDFGTRAV